MPGRRASGGSSDRRFVCGEGGAESVVSQAHNLLYYSTMGLGVIKKQDLRVGAAPGSRASGGRFVCGEGGAAGDRSHAAWKEGLRFRPHVCTSLVRHDGSLREFLN